MHALHRNFAKLMIWGAPGIGKTAILNAVVAQIAKELDILTVAVVTKPFLFEREAIPLLIIGESIRTRT